jgi:hypothetical protein
MFYVYIKGTVGTQTWPHVLEGHCQEHDVCVLQCVISVVMVSDVEHTHPNQAILSVKAYLQLYIERNDDRF